MIQNILSVIIGAAAVAAGLLALYLSAISASAERGIELLKIFVLCLLVLAVLTGCQSSTLSATDQALIERRFEVMAAMSGGTIPPPTIRWSYDPKFNRSAWTECLDFSVTLNARINQPEFRQALQAYGGARAFMANVIVPHEYAHLLSCYHRGNIHGGDGNSHDEYWRQAVIKLNGDPEYI